MGNTVQKPQEIEEQQQEEEATNFTCEICIEPMLSNKKFKNKNLCVHPFCLDCIAKYIKVKIEDHTANIECPGLNCKHPLDPLSCRPIIPKEPFDQWCDLLCEVAVLEVESCYCPNRECSVLVLNECGGTVKKSKCPDCKKNFCFQCKIPWHAGYRCSESGELRDRNDILFGELIERRNWSRCYKCGQSVERISGCRLIKCRCGTHFCYSCGGPTRFCSCEQNGTCCTFNRNCCTFILWFIVLGSIFYIVHVVLGHFIKG